MDIAVRKKGKVSILRISGVLTAGGDAKVRAKVWELLEEGDRLFIFNLSEVPFIDSVGLGEMVACTKRICERDGAVKLVLSDPGKPREVFKATGLNNAYQIFTDEQEAIASWIP